MINFKSIPDELENGVKAIDEFVNIPDSIEITAISGNENKIVKNGNKCEIVYAEKSYFFRALGLISEISDNNEFNKTEKRVIRYNGIQLDFSRNGALNLKSIKRFLSYMALMGMNKFYLYIEDMFELPERKYFGYMRGGYSKAELKQIDDMGFDYGIEVIPSIQVLGHHWQYMQWAESCDIRDTLSEILVDNEKSYEFIESMIVNALEPFRTKTIFIGMDETHTLGLGAYLKKNGYEKPDVLFLRHLNKVYEITDKLGLRAIVASDMFFNNVSDKHYYYDEKAKLTEEMINNIPENAVLCYWHYGEEYGCDDYMMEKHKQTGKEFIFYGGSWTWSGHLPETGFALDCTKLAMEACKKFGVEEAIITVWGDDGNECNHFYSLLTAQLSAEYAYGNESEYKKRFEVITGADAEAFIEMSGYQNINDGSREYETFSPRFRGKAFFWQDVLLGQLDYNLMSDPMSDHYRKEAEYFSEFAEREGKWQRDYNFAYNIFRCLEYKCYVAERLVKAYKEKDMSLLSSLRDILENKLLPVAYECHRIHKKIWFEDYRPFGWEVEEKRYAALCARIVTAVERLDSYLNGEIDAIEELEAERLPFSYSPFIRHSKLSTTTYES